MYILPFSVVFCRRSEKECRETVAGVFCRSVTVAGSQAREGNFYKCCCSVMNEYECILPFVDDAEFFCHNFFLAILV